MEVGDVKRLHGWNVYIVKIVNTDSGEPINRDYPVLVTEVSEDGGKKAREIAKTLAAERYKDRQIRVDSTKLIQEAHNPSVDIHSLEQFVS